MYNDQSLANLSPDRFPLHFFNSNRVHYFTSYDREKYFKIEDAFEIKKIRGREFVDRFDSGDVVGSLYEGHFENEVDYLVFILKRLTVDPYETNLEKLPIQTGHLVYTPYNSLEVFGWDIGLKKSIVGSWKIFDVPLYRMLKGNINVLNLKSSIKRGHFKNIGKEVIVLSLSTNAIMERKLGYWILIGDS